VSLALLTKHLRVSNGKKRKPTKQTRATRNTSDPLTSPNALELNLGLRVDRSLDLCLGVKSIALVLNAMCGMLGWLEWRWLRGINSPQPPKNCCRWAHRTVRCATGHYPVRHRTLSGALATSPNCYGSGAVDRWRLCPLVASDSPVPHRTCTAQCPVRL
jgi:hypothetical protein